MALPSFITLAERLPTGLDDVDTQIRKQLFKRFDPNGNGYLSLAELDKGLLVQFKLDGDSDFVVKKCKPAILRAFQAAKDISEDGGYEADYVTRSEFRLLLVYLQRYFELLAVFDAVDTGDDKRIDINEFKAAVPKLAEWGVRVANPAAEFAAIDTNGGGHILFDEFAGWALKQGLQLLDDPPEDGEESLVNRHLSAEEAAAKAASQPRAAAQASNAAPGGIPTWVTLAKKLPTGKDDKGRAQRKRLFDLFDPNGNGFLSLAEIDKGLIVQFQLDGGDDGAFAAKRCKPAINRAFQAAKDYSGETEGTAGDYVSIGEFRILLIYLKRYFELLAVFHEVDTGCVRGIPTPYLSPPASLALPLHAT